ncbi:MAG: 16S rRNA (guanine(966)-N(2))-methyltransferase RsmD [Candidatus Omnitrophota bacterium]|nr:16S rRNA (guanine(966)-N(2))-methyltransferase RsmD [Candidatus Omnitrophota bacterium]
MRIIGGEYRSRLIQMPKGIEVRPTQDRVREAIFNILGDINGKVVLDLFAGSGAFGLEALSRGASHVTFVENNSRCLAVIEENVGSLNIPDSKSYIARGSVLSLLPKMQRDGNKYDIIFLDPPYHKDMARKCLINIDYRDILPQFGLVVAEHFKKDSLEADLDTLETMTERKYGDTLVTIYRKTS